MGEIASALSEYRSKPHPDHTHTPSPGLDIITRATGSGTHILTKPDGHFQDSRSVKVESPQPLVTPANTVPPKTIQGMYKMFQPGSQYDNARTCGSISCVG